MDAAAALKLSIREKRTKWSFLSPVTSVFTVFLLSSVLSSSPVNCDIIYSAAKESESSIPLVIEVLRYYENSGKVKSVNEQDVCHKNVEAVLHGFTENEFWATRMVDASGNIGPGFVWGANFFLGSKTACNAINQKRSLGISSDAEPLNSILAQTPPVPVAYQVFIANFTSNHQIDVQFNVRPLIHVGLCLPKSCNVNVFYDSLKDVLESEDMYEIQNVTVQYHKEGLDDEWALWKIPELYILALIGAISICLSLLYTSTLSPQRKDQNGNIANCEAGVEKTTPTSMQKVVSCFSLTENYKKIVQTSTPTKEIRPINGIKSIACLWIIVLHSNIYSRFAVGSLPEVQDMMSSAGAFMRTLMYGFVSVDSFFVVSGFLLVFNFLNNDSLRKDIQESPWTINVRKFLRCVLMRYLRLTPSVIVTMIAIGLLSKYLDQTSIFDIRTNIPDLQCSSNTILLNLIYGQNIGNSFLICGSWLWYLANDMQYYIIFLALLFVHTKHPVLAKTVFAFVTLAALGTTFTIAYLNGFTFEADVMYRLYETLYTAPHIRVIPFQAGALVGYLGYRLKKHPIVIKEIPARIAWVAVIGYLLAPILFGSDVDTISSLICSLGYSVGKFIYGLSLGGLIILNVFAPDCLAQRILSHNCFVHLNKLCYGMYLVHPLVIILLFGLRSQPTYLSESLLVTYSLAVSALSYVIAFGLSLLVEMPLVKLSNLLR